MEAMDTSYVLFGSAIFGRLLLSKFSQNASGSTAPAKNNSANTGDTTSSRRMARALIRKKFSAKQIPEGPIDTVIIGSGMSGLSCAAILARLGHKVLVLEQHNDVAGGGSHQFDLKGYRFDSGLHYTVPWSVPIFSLTCLKSVDEVVQFDLMGNEEGIVDKIYLAPPSGNAVNDAGLPTPAAPFDMKHGEKHLKQLYADYPDDHAALNQFMTISDQAMLFVKFFLAGRLLPPWMQDFLWTYVVPKSLMEVAGQTAKEILPKLTNNKRLVSLLSSMWIDTGARPDIASFMMTAAVFRGVSMEGGCYPALGSEEMAVALTKTIVEHGGSVLIRADVTEIVVEDGKATGVNVRTTPSTPAEQHRTDLLASSPVTFIPCRRVVSSAGYSNTFNRLVSEDVTNKLQIPRTIPGVEQSAGFVMANIGIAASPAMLDIDCTNSWHIPVDADFDGFPALEKYFEDPLAVTGGTAQGIPAFITFPGIKDKEWSAKNPNKTSCQILMMAEHKWFEKFAVSASADSTSSEAQYEALKEQWRQRALQLLTTYFPKIKNHEVELADISTTLSIAHWLRADQGGAVGIDVTPKRFTDPVVRRQLDITTPIQGLYMTGQDTVLCGVTLCQLAGVITAFRMDGFWAGASIIGQSVWRDLSIGFQKSLGLRKKA